MKVWCAAFVLDLVRGLNKRIGSKRLQRAGNITYAQNLVSKQFQSSNFSQRLLVYHVIVMLQLPQPHG